MITITGTSFDSDKKIVYFTHKEEGLSLELTFPQESIIVYTPEIGEEFESITEMIEKAIGKSIDLEKGNLVAGKEEGEVYL